MKNKNSIRKNKKQKKGILMAFSPNFDGLLDSNRKLNKDDYYYDALELLCGGVKEIKEALR